MSSLVSSLASPAGRSEMISGRAGEVWARHQCQSPSCRASEGPTQKHIAANIAVSQSVSQVLREDWEDLLQIIKCLLCGFNLYLQLQ